MESDHRAGLEGPSEARPTGSASESLRADAAELQAAVAEDELALARRRVEEIEVELARAEDAVRDAEDEAGRATRRLEAKNLLLSQFEHKLKSTFSVLTGWAQTLDESWESLSDADRSAGVHAIRARAEETVEQARALLRESRAENDIGELEASDVDVTGVVRDVVDDFAANPGLTQRFAYVGAERVHALCDEPAVQQIVSQLLENAGHYAPAGSSVEVDVRSTGDWCVVEVSDAGPGLSEGVDVFAPFVRGPNRSAPGSGIGLYIVTRLADALAGDVSAAANDRGGTTFRVRLPR